ncbi:asparaginase domain-containing protein [Candidatus Neomarinimicrobiota bacterium]
MEKKIRIIVTGGTFDKEYNEINGELYFKNTHVQNMLELGRSRLDLNIRTLMMIDSCDMDEEDRNIIVKNCEKASEEKIIITHGTDTMVETAKLLAKTIKDKTIILTGAMVPYTFGSSDGLFNMGSAIAFAQTLPAGVYIVMNGQFFNWDNVRKNKKIGEFEELD